MLGFGHGQGIIEDPGWVLDLIQDLMACRREFQMKVDGTNTLPYTGQLQDVEPRQQRMTVKLLRPLPSELASGARFHMTFAAAESRFDAPTAYRQRRDYLQYDFTLPRACSPADRRVHTRYPFRPRENVVVLARMGNTLGLMGTLLNLSMGGLGMRIDRVLRLDDGLRIPAAPGLFDSTRHLPCIRIQGLPRLPLVEMHGSIVRTEEFRDGLLLGIAFGELEGQIRNALADCLQYRSEAHPAGPRQGPISGIHSHAEPKGMTYDLLRSVPEISTFRGTRTAMEEATDILPPLRRLTRRTLRVRLFMRPGPDRDRVVARLRNHGFFRIEPFSDPVCLRVRPTEPTIALLEAAALASAAEEPLALARRLEQISTVPMGVLYEQVDPSVLWATSQRLRFLPVHTEEEPWWVGSLDDLGDAWEP